MNRSGANYAIFIVVLGVLAGCATRSPAPVIDRASTPRPPSSPAAAAPAVPPPKVADARPETYVVRRGDTLYNIALDQGLDYRELAQWNSLSDPNRIQVGQELRLRAPEGAAQVSPVRSAGSVESRPLGTQPQRRVRRGERRRRR